MTRDIPVPEDKLDLLSDAEVLQLTFIAAYSSGKKGITSEIAAKVINWANGVRIDSALLRLVMDGELTVRWADDDFEFKLIKDGSEKDQYRKQIREVGKLRMQ